MVSFDDHIASNVGLCQECSTSVILCMYVSSHEEINNMYLLNTSFVKLQSLLE